MTFVDIRAVTSHEAGHAIAAVHVGAKVKHVSALHRESATIGDYDFEQGVFIALAGPLAESKQMGGTSLILRKKLLYKRRAGAPVIGDTGDYQHLLKLCREAGLAVSERRKLILKIGRKVRRFLNQPRAWRAISELATELGHKQRISGKAVAGIYRSAA